MLMMMYGEAGLPAIWALVRLWVAAGAASAMRQPKRPMSRRGFSGQVDQSKIGLPGEEDSCHARRGISHRSSEKKR
jgi:hypothetical protein